MIIRIKNAVEYISDRIYTILPLTCIGILELNRWNIIKLDIFDLAYALLGLCFAVVLWKVDLAERNADKKIEEAETRISAKIDRLYDAIWSRK